MADFVRRKISRRKMENESYKGYYYEKMELIQSIGFEGEDAIDLVADGISYPIIKEQASSGIYKTPEALLEYLSSRQKGDSKNPVKAYHRSINKNSYLNYGKVRHHTNICRTTRHSQDLRELQERYDSTLNLERCRKM